MLTAGQPVPNGAGPHAAKAPISTAPNNQRRKFNFSI
jgi:hypothetical protein